MNIDKTTLVLCLISAALLGLAGGLLFIADTRYDPTAENLGRAALFASILFNLGISIRNHRMKEAANG